MVKRAVVWAGGALVAIAAITMGVYFAAVGLDRADKLASTIGAFIGLVGLALAIYGTVTTRQPTQTPEQPAPAQSPPSLVHNEIHDGVFHGPSLQGRDFDHIKFDFPSRPVQPQDAPETSAEE